MTDKSIFDKVRKSVEKALRSESVIPPKEQIIARLKREKDITDSIPTEWSKRKNENIYR